MGIVALELSEEFVGSGELSIGFVDAGDSIDDEFAEAVILDEVKEASGELVEKGAFVVFNDVSAGFTCKGEYKVGGQADTPLSHH